MSEVNSFTVASVGKILPGGTNWTELIVGEFGGLINEVFHGQCAVKEKAKALDRVRE